MSTASDLISASQLAAMPASIGRCELIDGVIKTMLPVGRPHARLVSKLTWMLEEFTDKNGLGEIYSGDLGFIVSRNPDTVIAPNIAFLSWERLEGMPEQGFLPTAPNLAIEVVSPSDRFSEVEEKASKWLAAGCNVVLVVEPRLKAIFRYTSEGRTERLEGAMILDGGEVLPNWTLRVEELFEGR